MTRLILPSFFVLAAVGLFFWFTDPLYEEIKVKKAEEQQYNQALDNSKELLAIRDRLLSKYNTFTTADLGRLSKLLPDTIDNVRLVLDLDTMAARYGMRVRGVAIASQGIDENERGQIGSTDSLYGQVTLSFKVAATYETLLTFLKDLEESLRLVDITSISFAQGEGEAAEYTISLKTYWLK